MSVKWESLNVFLMLFVKTALVYTDVAAIIIQQTVLEIALKTIRGWTIQNLCFLDQADVITALVM